MSHSTAPGAQQYPDAEFEGDADRGPPPGRGVVTAACAVGDTVPMACIRAGRTLHRARVPAFKDESNT